MYRVYKEVIPSVHRLLKSWKEKAFAIPDQELRKQALDSMNGKTFHCEGGAIYGLLGEERMENTIRFIVAYQTISDYLDNLCDRSTSLDPDDFRALHQAMVDALTPHGELRDYYRFRKEKNDGGYLASLVRTCQQCVASFPQYSLVQKENLELASLYCDLQVHKHVTKDERVPRLEAWFNEHKAKVPNMCWYEFSACSGSTLGIFCLTSYSAVEDKLTKDMVGKIKNGYFPWVQGLHILMDYFIDQEEDAESGDLNFCSYYENEETMLSRIEYFYREAHESIRGLPDEGFHRMINDGLLAIYLADEKVKKDPKLRKKSKRFVRRGGPTTFFFLVNGLFYRKKSGT